MALHALIELQQIDTHIDQIRHQMSALPEHILHAEVTNELRNVEKTIDEHELLLMGLRAKEHEIEDEADSVQSRVATLDTQSMSASVSARDLPAMAEEVAHLKKRRDELDEQALALMDELELHNARAVELADTRTALTDQLGAHEEAIAEKSADLKVQMAQLENERSGLAKSIDEQMLAEYERLRTRLGGVGAAQLINGSCTGCHMSFSPTEQDVMRKSTSPLHCEQCGRILVVE